ncbi:hypothetical protein A7U60_g8654 [Sanghuangporus baumii]|uniref:Uncharacterized protein n=1 Tax=Sanghuangporus baumii TaxID=108892 RepID=A0A9Q5HQ80_SANBA|nr:hypothetical protein A7U60_g8654 [Sanghuangporus baumii]
MAPWIHPPEHHNLIGVAFRFIENRRNGLTEVELTGKKKETIQKSLWAKKAARDMARAWDAILECASARECNNGWSRGSALAGDGPLLTVTEEKDLLLEQIYGRL